MKNFYQSNKSYEYIENGIHYLKTGRVTKTKFKKLKIMSKL